VTGRILAAAAAVGAVVVAGPLLNGLARRIMEAPRRLPGEAALAPAIDALGGEVVRLRSRDGLRLAGRWLLADAEPGTDWAPDPREAILLLHGYSGSIAPDLVEYAPFLRRTASVLGLDFGGHGDSDDAPTTFGMREVEDVAGALAWLGERGIHRVAIFGTSMGGMTALVTLAVLGDGRLDAADRDPDAPALTASAPRPRIVCAVADSVAPELRLVVGNRMPLPFGSFFAELGFGRIARILGSDPRATEPIRVVGLAEDVPLLLIHGGRDETVPLRDGLRLAASAPATARHVVLPEAAHAGGHHADPEGYERMVTTFIRGALAAVRPGAASTGTPPILSADTSPEAGPPVSASGAS
jgi:uncharacterized protein